MSMVSSGAVHARDQVLALAIGTRTVVDGHANSRTINSMTKMVMHSDLKFAV